MDYKFFNCVVSLTILNFLAFSSACGQTALPLVRDGKSDYTIVVATDSTPPQRYAAEELVSVI